MDAPTTTLPAGDYVLACDKPPGVTSHDVVASIRRALPRRCKVGHAGTLDPFATGLLLVLVGRATRAQRFLMALRKTYVAVARFGAVSDTGDPDGEIVVTGRVPHGELSLPTGELEQRPPDFSAVKVGGRRAYALARAGERPALAPRRIHVYRFEELSRADERRTFEIECSSGTYVRTLLSDLGDAYCEALRRTRIGDFDVADADPRRPIELSRALSFMPGLRIDAEQGRRLAQGQALALGRLTDLRDARDGAELRVIDPDGLVALARVDAAAGALRPVVGLRG